MKIAIVHEWLTTFAGAEKVLTEMISVFPSADIFCLLDFLSQEDRMHLSNAKITTSFLQHIPFAKSIYRHLLPLMPLAVEQHDLSSYDLIISNSHAVAKGVLTGPDQLHICYCYTPIRYAWDFQHQYLAESKLTRGIRSAFVRYFLHRLRVWDLRTANAVDHFVSCSEYIARRVWRVYRRRSCVIYPNVEVTKFVVRPGPREDFYLTVSRLVPYKKIQLIVKAFALMPDKRLVVIGAGPLLKDIRSMATPNVQILGHQPFDVLLDYLQRAKCFVFASEEDFGIAPLEAQACGTPVLAYGRGGASETVIHGVTGLHFWEQTASAISDCVEMFEREQDQFDPIQIRAHAEKFSSQIFRERFKQFVESKWHEHCERIKTGHERCDPLKIEAIL